MASREGNLNFFPDRVEAIARNSINDGNKRLASRQTRVRLVNEVEGCVVLNQGLFSGRREFNELDVEQIVVVIGRNCFTRAGAPSRRGWEDCDRQSSAGDQFRNVVFYSVTLV